MKGKLIEIGGHIGYGIRPSERRKGYATIQLGLLLEKLKELNIEQALITCRENNIGSKKTMEKFIGKSDTLVPSMHEGIMEYRYWIDVNKNLKIDNTIKTKYIRGYYMNYLIRRKTKEDCDSVAHVVTVAWNETYKGIVNDEFLNNLYENEEQRANNSYNNFNEDDNHQLVLEVDNQVVGFVNVGETDDKFYDNCGELHAIYIIGEYKGNGFGKKLFEAGKEELKSMGFDKMLIGCLDGNPSNAFYKHMGGKLIKTRMFEKLQLPENVYYFEKI